MTLRARDIADICDELAIERASVTVMGGWDPDATSFALSFGPLACRKTVELLPSMTKEQVTAKLALLTDKFDQLTVPTILAATEAEAKAFKPAKEMPGKVEIAHPPKPAQKRKKAK